MRKFLLFVVVMSLAVPAFVFADEPGETGVYEFGVRQGEVHPLLSRALHDEWVVFNRAKVRAANGLFFDAWYTFQPGKPTTGLGPATDSDEDAAHLALGWQSECLSFSTGVHDMYPMSHVASNEDLLEQRLEFRMGSLYNRNGETWDANLGFAWVSTTTFREGALVTQPRIVNHWEHAFGFESATLDQSFTVSLNQGFDEPGLEMSSRGICLRWELGIAWDLDKHTTLFFPQVVRQFPLQRGDDGRGEEWELTAGVGFRF